MSLVLGYVSTRAYPPGLSNPFGPGLVGNGFALAVATATFRALWTFPIAVFNADMVVSSCLIAGTSFVPGLYGPRLRLARPTVMTCETGLAIARVGRKLPATPTEDALAVPLTVFDANADEPEKKDKCGVFGVWGTPDAAALAYAGIFAQQHRGQESAGIAVVAADGQINGHTGMGLVSQVFTPRLLREELTGSAAIGHVRYSTTGSSKLCNAQPLLRQFHLGPMAVAHNGNLINAALIRDEYERHGHIFQSTTDTEIIVHLLAKPAHAERPDPLVHVLRHLQGAFSLVFLFPDRMEAVRDPWGVRPLALGKTAGGQWCVASETCAFDAIDATYVRDVEPGEIVASTTPG